MRQSFDPKIWGPHAWFFLETVVMAYPIKPTNEDKSKILLFFNTLQYVIPCDKCRINYSRHLKEHPLTNKILEDRDNLFKWIVTIHNLVDTSKKKTTKEVYNYYIDQYNENNTQPHINYFCDNKKLKNILTIIMIITTIILIHKVYLYFYT